MEETKSQISHPLRKRIASCVSTCSNPYDMIRNDFFDLSCGVSSKLIFKHKDTVPLTFKIKYGNCNSLVAH